MLEREVVSKLKSGRSLALIMPLIIGIVVGISPSMAFSQQQKKNRTVGDILKTIEKQARESQIQKEKSALPEAAAQQKSAPKTYKITAPKSSKFYYEQGSDEGALEQATDDAIKQTVRVIKRLGRSPKRGELWLRLAELYVDKARLIDFRIQNKYDEQLKLYQEGKVKSRPKLVLDEANKYNIEAIKLYELFLKDFPKDDKVPQALYFLGYNYFELGDVAKGEVFYRRLTKEYPKSTYVTESNFTLGEYYFEKENYKEAHKYYVRVVKDKSHRLYSFGWYKLAWSLFKLGEHSKAIAGLRQVIFIGRKNKGQSESDGRVPQIKLASEAIKDLVLFYGESGKYKTARSDFKKIVGTKNLDRMIERLGYYYVDTGNRDGARYLFKQLIESDPNAEKAFDYQYQIVNLYSSAGSSKVLRSELYGWIQGYGPGSLWAKSNAQNPELVTKSHALIETTLRNYVLRQHQAAQNSRSKFSQQQAKAGYQLYFNTFKQTEKSDEMHFFFGELLFDVGDYERAAYHYLWVADNAPNSKYMEQSTLNALLALEKNLPQPAEIRKIVGKSIKPVPFDRTINAFIKAAGKYTKSYAESENYVAIRYKVGSLLYYYNHFDEALEIFWDLVEKHSSTKYSQFAANNILDIYNLKKDYVGLEKAAERLLGVQNIAKSDVGSQIKDVKLKTAFKQARQLEEGKDYAGSAKAYEDFALKNPMSELARANSLRVDRGYGFF
ncbi:MAG: tetratricopeptide repeat protein [Bdellovibrionales bacterium]|nr:tetratricopeptide repeat protein [Bdellovibrionales bacterium]